MATPTFRDSREYMCSTFVDALNRLWTKILPVVNASGHFCQGPCTHPSPFNDGPAGSSAAVYPCCVDLQHAPGREGCLRLHVRAPLACRHFSSGPRPLCLGPLPRFLTPCKLHDGLRRSFCTCCWGSSFNHLEVCFVPIMARWIILLLLLALPFLLAFVDRRSK